MFRDYSGLFLAFLKPCIRSLSGLRNFPSSTLAMECTSSVLVICIPSHAVMLCEIPLLPTQKFSIYFFYSCNCSSLLLIHKDVVIALLILTRFLLVFIMHIKRVLFGLYLFHLCTLSRKPFFLRLFNLRPDLFLYHSITGRVFYFYMICINFRMSSVIPLYNISVWCYLFLSYLS